MWRTILRPDVLFTITSAQALSPYIFWRLGLGEFKGQASLTYLPVLVWVSGWIAFLVGTLLVSRGNPQSHVFGVSPNRRTLRIATIVVIVVICAQLISLAKLYGGFPILSYIRQDGAINIGTAIALQQESGVGQVGSVYVTTALLHGLVLLLLISNLEEYRRDQLLIALAFIVLLAAHGINGKREGFFRCVVFLLTGLCLYAREPLRALTYTLPLLRHKWLTRAVMLGGTGLLLLSFGYLAAARNQGQYGRNSLQEIIVYQEYPLLNFETQCASAGLGPYELNYFFWLRRLVPWKLMDALGVADQDLPARYDPWAPAGLYEDVQWSLGIAGVIGYAFLIGLITMWCYHRARCSPFCLLAYSQMSFGLMLAHSFNDFVNLSWIPAPLLLFAILCGTLRRTVATPRWLSDDSLMREARIEHA